MGGAGLGPVPVPGLVLVLGLGSGPGSRSRLGARLGEPGSGLSLGPRPKLSRLWLGTRGREGWVGTSLSKLRRRETRLER